MSNDIDNWMDYLIKRWPIVAAVFVLILGVAKTQWIQNAQADQIREMRESIVGLDDMQAEWPYLKKRLEDVNSKVDKMDDKIDLLVRRSS